METKVTDPCSGCAIAERGCMIKNTYQKVACSCITCLVKVMCSQVCVVRFNCVEEYYKAFKVKNDPDMRNLSN